MFLLLRAMLSILDRGFCKNTVQKDIGSRQLEVSGQSPSHRVNMRLVCFLSSPKWGWPLHSTYTCTGPKCTLLATFMEEVSIWSCGTSTNLLSLKACVFTVTWPLCSDITDGMSSPCHALGRLTSCVPKTLAPPGALLNQGCLYLVLDETHLPGMHEPSHTYLLAILSWPFSHSLQLFLFFLFLANSFIKIPVKLHTWFLHLSWTHRIDTYNHNS